MKNAAIGILLILTLAFGGLCFWQQIELKRARSQAASIARLAETERAAREEQEARAREVQRQRDRLGGEVQQLNALTMALRAAEAKQSSNFARLAPAGQAGAGGGENALAGGKGMGEMLQKMMKDPAMKEVIRAQQKAMMNMMYGPMFKELQLSEEQTQKLHDLLLDQQMQMMDKAGAMFGDAKEDFQKVAQLAEAQKQQADEQARALLGDEKYAQYQDYQKTMGERMQLNQFQQQLAGGGNALQDAQSKALLQFMQEEKTRTPPVIDDLNGQSGRLPDLREIFSGDKLDRQFAWQTDLNQRVLERAAQVLSPEQLKEYGQFQSQQMDMQRLGLKMARQMYGGEGEAPK